jgi:hypothetical protein
VCADFIDEMIGGRQLLMDYEYVRALPRTLCPPDDVGEVDKLLLLCIVSAVAVVAWIMTMVLMVGP